MKKKINGRIYNTDTAKQVAWYGNNLPANDFGYIEECLYRKRNGEYFLAGEGGARTRYAADCGDGWTRGGEDIIPLTRVEAFYWSLNHSRAVRLSAYYDYAQDDFRCISPREKYEGEAPYIARFGNF